MRSTHLFQEVKPQQEDPTWVDHLIANNEEVRNKAKFFSSSQRHALDFWGVYYLIQEGSLSLETALTLTRSQAKIFDIKYIYDDIIWKQLTIEDALLLDNESTFQRYRYTLDHLLFAEKFREEVLPGSKEADSRAGFSKLRP